MKYLVYILSAVMLLSACSRSSFNEELSTVDSLITEYNQLTILIDSMPIKKVKEYFIDYNNFFDDTKKQIVKIEKKDLEDLSFIDHFKGVKKGFKNFDKKQAKLQKKINRNITELNNLKTDLEHNIHTKQLIKSYIQEERKELLQLVTTHNKYLKVVKQQKAVLDSLKTIIPIKIENLNHEVH